MSDNAGGINNLQTKTPVGEIRLIDIMVYISVSIYFGNVFNRIYRHHYSVSLELEKKICFEIAIFLMRTLDSDCNFPYPLRNYYIQVLYLLR